MREKWELEAKPSKARARVCSPKKRQWLSQQTKKLWRQQVCLQQPAGGVCQRRNGHAQRRVFIIGGGV